jgi:DNA-binding NarL/FixJ family response regulator
VRATYRDASSQVSSAFPRVRAGASAMKRIRFDRGPGEKTVESHRANVLAKLEMRDRVELVRYAIRRGLIEP